MVQIEGKCWLYIGNYLIFSHDTYLGVDTTVDSATGAAPSAAAAESATTPSRNPVIRINDVKSSGKI